SNYSLTVKMRLGFMKLEEGILVTELLNKYPLKGVIIHARTGKQMYTGNVDLEGFGALNNLCKHEVTYNGDVFTPENLTRICQRFPTLDNFMLGRGALRNPFLPSMIKGHTLAPLDKISMIRQFHAEIYSHYKKVLSGDKHLCDKMSEFWEYMSIHFDSDGKFIKRIKKCHTSLDYLNTVEQLFIGKSFTD
ncbi:MAG: tRNA-dihydrouridine synthase, partial [Vallitaleaceae bacterium]|nr:tRNA-dihydrouridine synthase [Vallitaleaceae bacterium]